MLRKLCCLCFAIYVYFYSVSSLVVSMDLCPACGPELASRLRAELFDVHSKVCGPLVGMENILEDVRFLQFGVAEMLKGDQLQLRGGVGHTGSDGRSGDTGMMGSRGASGRSGVRGRTGPTGDTGSTGQMGFTGVQGTRGYYRVKREDPGTSKTCKQIQPLLVKCPQASNFFQQYANGIETRCSRALESPGKSEIESLENLISRYHEVLVTFQEVKKTFDQIKGQVQTDPRYKGATGEPGRAGFTGGTGASGRDGMPGSDGATGPRGGFGSPGATGPMGDTGPRVGFGLA